MVDTYLTVDGAGGIESEHVKDYSDESAHTCQGVNLIRGMINARPWPCESRPGEVRDRPRWSTDKGDVLE